KKKKKKKDVYDVAVLLFPSSSSLSFFPFSSCFSITVLSYFAEVFNEKCPHVCRCARKETRCTHLRVLPPLRRQEHRSHLIILFKPTSSTSGTHASYERLWLPTPST
ncbi:hypothetical protein BC936DRAFT_147900, partial [Jimgerdemannia flammicorona]